MNPSGRERVAGESIVAAWDYEHSDRERIVQFSVGDTGAHQVEERSVPRSLREDHVDALIANGIRIGGCYAGTDIVWVADDSGFAVWNKSTCLAKGKRAANDVARVHVWIDEEDPGRRGVRFDLVDGDSRTIAEEHVPIVANFPTSGIEDLDFDTLWAHYLGLHLALWHGVELVNDIRPDSISDDLAIRRIALELASRVTADAKELSLSLGALDRATELIIRVTAGEQVRSVETRVTISGSSECLIRVVKQGPSEQVAAFLRRVTTPSALLRAMNDLINKALA